AEARHLETIRGLAGRQQFTGRRPAGLDKIEPHGSSRPGHAGDDKIAIITRPISIHGERRMNDLPGIRIKDAYRGGVALHTDQALVDRKGTDRRAHVSAIALVVDPTVPDLNLGKGVIDVRVIPRRGREDTDLGQRGDAPAHAVELPAV